MKASVKAYIDDRFEKIKILQQNSKGEVYLAQVKETGEFVIIKRVNLTGLPYKKLRKNFNPLFAKILLCAEDSDDTVVVEEFIQGETLIERLNRENFFSEDEALKILLQLCDGLKFLHELGIVHRDIKPSNLILQAGGIVRLIDFDAARIVKANKSEDTNALGTKGYAPPEQYGYGQTDNRSDIYSLGVTMQKLLGKNYHGRFKNILAKCTEIDPKNRWQSVDELKNALIYQKNFVAEKSFSRWKIAAIGILICTVIFALYNFFPANQTENSPQTENLPQIENPAENSTPNVETPPIVETPTYTAPPLNNSTAIDNSTADEKVKFPEIILPQTSTFQPPPAQIDSTLPNLEVPAPNVEPMTPSTPQVDYHTPQPFKKENSIANADYVKAEYFLDGERIQAWTDTFDIDLPDVSPADYYNISYDEWKNWTKVAPNSTAINFPPSIIEVLVKNFSDKTLTNPQLEVIFTNNRREETKILRGKDIAPGQTITFTVPLNQFHIDNPNYQIVNATFDRIVLKFSGDGAKIIGSNAKVGFHFIQP